MIKGMVQISKDIRYRIFALEKQDPQHGEILADLDWEDQQSRIVIYKNGDIMIQSPQHNLSLNLITGKMEFS